MASVSALVGIGINALPFINLSRDDFIPPVRKVAHLCHRLNSLPFLTGEFSDLSVEVVKHLQGCRPEPGGVH
jgi:hypothetical protein